MPQPGASRVTDRPSKTGAESASPFIRGRPLDVDLPLHVTEVEGRTSSEATFLMLHGFGASSFTWRHWAPRLVEHGRILCVDYKGFGAAPKPANTCYGPVDQAKIIVQLIDQLELEHITLVGHSLGGGIALLTAKELCNRAATHLDRLVLIASLAYGQRLSPFIPLSRHPLLSRFLVRTFGSQRLIRWILRSIVYDPAMITSQMVDAYARPLTTRAGVEAILATGRKILADGINNLSEGASDIDVPTLLMWGDHERVVPCWVGERLEQDLPNARLVVVERCGHVPHEEAPAESFSILSSFLADTERATNRL